MVKVNKFGPENNVDIHYLRECAITEKSAKYDLQKKQLKELKFALEKGARSDQ